METSAAERNPAATTPTDLARELLAALNARDLDRAQALWHEDLVEDFVAVGVFHGRAAVRKFFADTYAAFPDFRIEVETLVGDEHVAFVAWHATGTFSGAPFQGIAATGASLELRGVDRMEFEEGLMVRNTIYYDGAGFARSVGMLPAMGSGAENAMKGAFNAVTRLKKSLGV